MRPAEDALLDRIDAGEEGARAVYADWLDEEGRGADAACLRAGAALDPEDPDPEMLARAHAALPVWDVPVDVPVRFEVRYRRGLPERLDIVRYGDVPPEAWAGLVRELVARAPSLREVRYGGTVSPPGLTAALTEVPRLRALQVTGIHGDPSARQRDPDDLADLLPRLESLELGWARGSWLAALRQAAPRLRHLAVAVHADQPAALEALAGLPLRSLELHLTGEWTDVAGLEGAALRTLRLACRSRSSSIDLASLGGLTALRALSCNAGSFEHPPGLAPTLRRLAWFPGAPASTECIAALAARLAALRLEGLRLGGAWLAHAYIAHPDVGPGLRRLLLAPDTAVEGALLGGLVDRAAELSGLGVGSTPMPEEAIGRSRIRWLNIAGKGPLRIPAGPRLRDVGTTLSLTVDSRGVEGIERLAVRQALAAPPASVRELYVHRPGEGDVALVTDMPALQRFGTRTRPDRLDAIREARPDLHVDGPSARAVHATLDLPHLGWRLLGNRWNMDG